MGERRFVIREAFDTFYDATESELKRRLCEIIAMEPKGRSLEQMAEDGLLILLYGTSGRDYTPKELARHLREHPEDKLEPWPGPDDILQMRGRHTRAEWEEWAAKVTDGIDDLIHGQLDTWIELKDALLSMPIVPKE